MILRLLLLVLILLSACKKVDNQLPLSPLASRGKSVYLSVCIACHNPDPTLDGSVGPAVAFSSLELITARVMRAEYPSGYKPKRSSAMMAALPMYEKDIPALHAYLNSFKK